MNKTLCLRFIVIILAMLNSETHAIPASKSPLVILDLNSHFLVYSKNPILFLDSKVYLPSELVSEFLGAKLSDFTSKSVDINFLDSQIKFNVKNMNYIAAGDFFKQYKLSYQWIPERKTLQVRDRRLDKIEAIQFLASYDLDSPGPSPDSTYIDDVNFNEKVIPNFSSLSFSINTPTAKSERDIPNFFPLAIYPKGFMLRAIGRDRFTNDSESDGISLRKVFWKSRISNPLDKTHLASPPPGIKSTIDLDDPTPFRLQFFVVRVRR